MADSIPQSGASNLPSIGGARPVTALPGGNAADPARELRGARFQALLEELDMRSQAMAKTARDPLSAEALPVAVENARASLENALQLSQDLLEACRQVTAQAPVSGVARP